MSKAEMEWQLRERIAEAGEKDFISEEELDEAVEEVGRGDYRIRRIQ